MLCEKNCVLLAAQKVKSGKRENHMVVDAKQGYNLFLMWEETSEFWHKQQPTFVKISRTSDDTMVENDQKSLINQFIFFGLKW